MIAKIAAAATITHFAHIAGHQKMAKTTTAAASKKRQKQIFMIFPPPSLNCLYFITKIGNIKTSPNRLEHNSFPSKPGLPNAVPSVDTFAAPNPDFQIGVISAAQY
jgi:hypothetical protein